MCVANAGFNVPVLFLCRKLADEELKTNIAESEVFTLPSGQEIEKENILLGSFFSTWLLVTTMGCGSSCSLFWQVGVLLLKGKGWRGPKSSWDSELIP